MRDGSLVNASMRKPSWSRTFFSDPVHRFGRSPTNGRRDTPSNSSLLDIFLVFPDFATADSPCFHSHSFVGAMCSGASWCPQSVTGAAISASN